MRPSPPLWCSVLVVTASLLSGCNVRIQEEEIQLRHVATEDTLEALFIYRGITPSQPDAKTLDGAVSLAEQFVGGRRIFMIGGWLMAPDLDDAAESLAAPDDGKPADSDIETHFRDPARRKELLDLLRGCTLEEHAGFLESEKTLCAYQVFRFRRISRIVEIVNTCISLAVLEAMREGSFDKEGMLDDRSRELWKQHAEGRKPWFLLEGGDLVAEVPITRSAWERLMRKAIDDLVASEGSRPSAGDAASQLILFLQLLGHVRRFEALDEKVALRLGAPVHGVWRFSFVSPPAAPDTRLLDALKKKGIEPDPKVTLDEVRKKLVSRVEGSKPAGGAPKDGG